MNCVECLKGYAIYKNESSSILDLLAAKNLENCTYGLGTTVLNLRMAVFRDQMAKMAVLSPRTAILI